ncbi:MAG: saccharopine dehydrogenase NADP-binding domain-containing protein [Deltaproteobacteria bacterium]|nr:saccharopine dehydrogenase NADP-binding domain-containing protein [Deltaproteobacteria bacterium]
MNGDPRVVVVGAGAMGRITVKDLFETARGFRIVVADYDRSAAHKLARSFASPRVRAAQVDVTDVAATTRLLKGAFAVVNAVQYQHNVPVMKAALAAGAHYTDLGGLFHVTRKQLEWHARFRKKGLLALLGMGAAPGTTNLLARDAADRMDEVHEIHVQVGGVDLAAASGSSPMGSSYSIQTILEEASRPAAVFTGGRFRFVPPMSGVKDVLFPDPVGLRRPALTIHSEVATLPLAYRRKGLRECTFAIAFEEELTDRLRFLRAIGVNSLEPVEVGRKKVVPQEVLLALLRRMPKPSASTEPPKQYEVIRAVVRGVMGGHAVEETIDCHVTGMPGWGFGIDVDTGCPPSIAVQMIAAGEITARGVLAPERAVPCEPYFAQLSRRGMTVRRPERSAATVRSARFETVGPN